MFKSFFYRTVLLVAVLCLFGGFAASQEYGLVLAGGGGKGAFEVGVWRAMVDYGLAQKVTAMSGTSVGGLNAALFACYGSNVDEIERIWITEVPTELTRDDALISQKGLKAIIKRTPIQTMQENRFPSVTVTAVRDGVGIVPKAVFNTVFGGKFCERFVLNNESSLTEIGQELLATAAVPVICDHIKLKDGYYYVDGGAGDNVPITPIVENAPKIKNIIIVYLDNRPVLMQRVKVTDYEDKNLIEVIPSTDLGGFLRGLVNFTQSRIELLIRQGYEDASALFESKGFKKVSSYWFEE